MYTSALVATLFWVVNIAAQTVVDDLSFGHKGTISRDATSIPGWSLSGEAYTPEILSDKVILTPPVGGMKRGAVWTGKKNSIPDWTLEVDFRTNGGDRAGGNLQIWYAKDGSGIVGTSSIYTVDKFDGLALVIDTVGGVQKIRGFLNDGNTNYKTHPMIESLAFGHCDHTYRNQGRPTQLKVNYGSSGLEVLVDGRQCFSTAKITLPSDYFFGVTAASSDPPDSFEVYRSQVSSSSGSVSQQQMGSMSSQQQFGSVPEPNDQPASHFTTSAAQFEDLHSRLHALSKSIHNLFGEIQRHTQTEENRYQEILRQLGTPSQQGSHSSTSNVESRLSSMERMLQDMSRDFKATDHTQHFERLSQQIEKNHQGLTEHIPSRLREYVQNHTPRIGFIAFSFMAFQSACLAVLLFQKYRKSTMPKKFL